LSNGSVVVGRQQSAIHSRGTRNEKLEEVARKRLTEEDAQGGRERTERKRERKRERERERERGAG